MQYYMAPSGTEPTSARFAQKTIYETQRRRGRRNMNWKRVFCILLVMSRFHAPQIHSRFKIAAGIPWTIMVSKSTHIIVGLGILSLLTVAVILSGGQTTPQRSRWLQRRLIRRRPTKTPLGHVQAGNNPSGSVKNRPESETQDFDNANDAARYWTDVHDGM